jgi:hypothetical protein
MKRTAIVCLSILTGAFRLDAAVVDVTAFGAKGDGKTQNREAPEPSMFGIMPAYGLFVRHASGVQLSDVDVSYIKEDRRPAFVLDCVEGITLEHCEAQKATGAPTLVMMNAKAVEAHHCAGLPDFRTDAAARKEM